MTARVALVALGLAASACTLELIDRGDDDDGDPLLDAGPVVPDAAPVDAPVDAPIVSDAAAFCGDGVVDALHEECDAAGWSATCDADCTLALCGDLVINELAGEECEPFTYPDAPPCDEMCQRLPFPWD